MFTPPKVAPGLLGVLALAFVAGAVQAENSTYRTAKNGWSTKATCERTGTTRDQRHCFVMTRGISVRDPGHVAAGLEYHCTTGGEEMLVISFWTHESVNSNDPPLSVQWDEQPKETMETWVHKLRNRGKRVYYFNIAEADGFIKRMAEHRTLTVDLPYRHARQSARFKLANALPSIASAVNECGYLVRSLMRNSG